MATQQEAVQWLNSTIGQHLDYGTDWRPVVYPSIKDGYFVSDKGYILSSLRGQGVILTNSVARGGYRQVCLTRTDGTTLSVKVHRLVATAFLPNPNNLPHLNHKDENRANNALSNLEWCTPHYNNYYSKAGYYKSLAGKGVGNNAKLSIEDIEDMKLFRANNVKLKDIARVYNVAHTYVCNLTRNNIVRTV